MLLHLCTLNIRYVFEKQMKRLLVTARRKFYSHNHTKKSCLWDWKTRKRRMVGPTFITLHSPNGTVCVLRMRLSNIRANTNGSAAVRVYFAIHIFY